MIERLVRKTAQHIQTFWTDEHGELSPVSYLIGFLLALMLIFFSLDLGLRKGARLAVEYAAYCGARAAATQLPLKDDNGACLSDEERTSVETATAACLASVVTKRGTLGILEQLVAQARSHTSILILNGGREVRSGNCLGHNAVVTVEVTYTHDIPVPMSPLFHLGDGTTKMVASASAMLQTVK